jgi:ribonuclease P protein component
MLPAINRLPSTDVSPLLRHGKRIRENFFDIVYSTRETGARFGFVVSMKVDKRATGRNRIKRLLREAVQHLLPDFSRGIDCVIVARGKVGNSRETTESMLRNSFIKIGVL